MIDKEAAIQIANDRLKKTRGTTKHKFDSCDFYNERTGRYSSPARWVVVYLKPPPANCTIDDGEQLIAVEVDAESGNATISRGF